MLLVKHKKTGQSYFENRFKNMCKFPSKSKFYIRSLGGLKIQTLGLVRMSLKKVDGLRSICMNQ